MNQRLGQHPHVAEIRGHGLLLGIEIVKDKEDLIPFSEEEKITNNAKRFTEWCFSLCQFRIICLGPAFIINDVFNLMTQVAIESIKGTENWMN